ncbi:hypothetical protein EDB92DRAFT_1812461 [Lactarius akahatsu]|uniref:Uncharacterized protein n=1 Tax=Lactarius akahatsu TaxID=416441 RepID=A0AAD4QIC6_9AGAM|nr:hypothetical protein EDB92DRAFT_1812461 [Lactarius akahatsu]
MATSNAPLKTTLTASTQLFATPRGAPQFGVAQVRVKARPCAERYLRGKSRQTPGSAPKRERRDLNLSKGVWKSNRDDTSQFKETGSQLGVGGCTRQGFQDPAEKPPQGPPPSDAPSPVPLGNQGTPSHTTWHCSDATTFIPIARFPVRTRLPPNQEWPLTHCSFATKPCRLSDVQERFQAPILAPLQQPLVTERSIRNEVAHGEQIQQKGHRVELSSSRVETLATSHPARWSSSEEHWYISACATEVAGVGGAQGLDARKTDRAAPGNWDRVEAICT